MIIFVFYAVSDMSVPILAYDRQDVISVLLLKNKHFN